MTDKARKAALTYVGKMRKWAMEPEANDCLDTIEAALEPKKERYINILFDGSEGPIAEFVDVENDDGESINIGEWNKKGNYSVLRIKVEGGK